MRFIPRVLSPLPLMVGCALLPTVASATVNFSIEPAQAQPGQTITIQAVYVNTTGEVAEWVPPTELVLHWHSQTNQPLQTTAQMAHAEPIRTVAVNGFVISHWHSTVPELSTGIQTLALEGSSQLLALDIAPQHSQALIDATPPDTTPTDAIAQPGLAYSPPTAFEQIRNAISSYEPIYFVVGNRPETNARFQLSFKYRLANPPSLEESRFYHHFYLGYTQRSLWDLSSDSIPFIDTTYNPSVFWYKEKLWETAQQPFYMGLNAGIEHKSNGKSGEDSRSLNDIYLQPEFNYTFNNGSHLKFMPRIKQYIGVSDDNADYRDYMGTINWRLRWQQANGLSIMGSYQHGKHGRQTHQVDIAWPLKRTPLNLNGYLYAQYFNGYGETLLHYSKHSQSQFRIGLALIP